MPPTKHVIPPKYAPESTLTKGQVGVTALNGEGPVLVSLGRAGEINLGTEDNQFILKVGDLPKLAYSLLTLHNSLGNQE